MRVRWSGMAVVLSMFLWSSNASADAIVITSGGGSLYWDGDLGGFQLIGNGTQITFDHHGNATDAFHSGATRAGRALDTPAGRDRKTYRRRQSA